METNMAKRMEQQLATAMRGLLQNLGGGAPVPQLTLQQQQQQQQRHDGPRRPPPALPGQDVVTALVSLPGSPGGGGRHKTRLESRVSSIDSVSSAGSLNMSAASPRGAGLLALSKLAPGAAVMACLEHTPPTRLKVHVVQARGLSTAAAELQLQQQPPQQQQQQQQLTNPFVEVVGGGDTKRTRVIPHTAAPMWDQSFELLVAQGQHGGVAADQLVSLRVLHRGPAGLDFEVLGELSVRRSFFICFRGCCLPACLVCAARLVVSCLTRLRPFLPPACSPICADPPVHAGRRATAALVAQAGAAGGARRLAGARAGAHPAAPRLR